jgi:hypothetical protein
MGRRTGTGRDRKEDNVTKQTGAARGRAAPSRRATVLGTALAGTVLLATACSGGGSHPSGPATPGPGSVQQMDLFAQCMRSHGESNFYFANPHSTPNPSATVLSITGHQVVGIDPRTAQFASAMKSCKHLLPGGGGQPISQQQLNSLVKEAECMRAHGFPEYPDPQRAPNGGVEEKPLPSSIDTSSPQFQAAEKTCGED